MNSNKRRINRMGFVILVTLALCVLLECFFCDDASAYSVNEVHLTNGQTYDITDAPKNTIVYIDDNTLSKNTRGQVTLKGSSEKVWVSISLSKGKTVIINLADGLTITPKEDSAYGTGSNSDTLGWSRSAIYIDETKKAGGIVVLRSMRDATIKLDSYQCGIWQSLPAIMKNDTKTTLIFDTEDRQRPGTIIAKPTSGGKYNYSGTCGIGAYGHGSFGVASSSYTVGNMVFAGGNIEAYGLTDGPGIGAYAYSNIDTIEFTGAHVVAHAGNSSATQFSECGGAGIGNGFKGRFEKIYISGGYVEAWGRCSNYDDRNRILTRVLDVGGCGIGGGWSDSHSGEIEITGGTVKAYGGSCGEVDSHGVSGCGIGTCSGRSYSSSTTLNKIVITGGDITAVGGTYTCGIGGTVKDIIIAPKDENTELKIDASIDRRKDRSGVRKATGAGIGITNNAMERIFNDYPGNITIKGGDITATSGYEHDGYGFGKLVSGAGIGTTSHARVNSINISGGRINAYGGWNCPGIGGPNHHTGTYSYEQTVGSINISGGTITATKAKYNYWNDELSAIGGYKYSDEQRTDIKITGGSIIANGDKYAIGYDTAGLPKNEKGDIVWGTKFNFNPDVSEWTKLDSFDFDPEIGYDYGFGDVYVKKGLDDESDENILEFWIPKTNPTTGYINKAKLAGRAYKSIGQKSIDAGGKETLTAYTDITYFNEITGDKYTGLGIYGNDRLTIKPDPMEVPMYELYGYDDDGGIKVASGNYNENKPRLVQGTKYVDSDGKWKANNEKLTLHMKFYQTKYQISYDANKPKRASHEVVGSMGKSIFPLTGESTLSDNEYSLNGWDFKGWNTKADGTGKAYANKENISYDKDWGERLTLYAQWQPKKYKVKFNSGDAMIGTVHEQTAEYDTTSALDMISEIGWTYDGHSFHGWTALGLGSFYEDGEDFYNLCTLDDNGNPQGNTLTADWVGNGNIKVTVTVDEKPTDVTDTMYIQKIDGSDTERVELTDIGNGHYEGVLAGIPKGEYQLLMDSDMYQIPQDKQYLGMLSETSAVSVVIDYYTVTMYRDDYVTSAYVKEIGTSAPLESMKVADNTQVTIGASVENGYHFDGYSYMGVEPSWSQDTSVAEQSIRIRGKVEISAHAEANLYHIKFDPNSKTKYTGNMKNQDMVFGETQKLWWNRFDRQGAEFIGWNTEADGSGLSFEDAQQIDESVWRNLDYPDNDSEITLYAMWELEEYKITYDLKGGEFPTGMSNPESYNVETEDIRLVNPVWPDDEFVFTGWIGTDQNNPSKELIIPSGSIGNRKYTAVWKEVIYKVSFDTDGGSKVDTQYVKIHRMPIIPMDPTREHYRFAGWYTDKTFAEAFDFNKEITEDTVAFAKWDRIMHTISYDLNGGSIDGRSGIIEVEAGEGEVIKVMNAPVRKGYKFKYWKGSKYQPGDDYVVKEDHTLTAQWQKESSGNGVSTGDDTNLRFVAILMISSMLLFSVMYLMRKAEKNKM